MSAVKRLPGKCIGRRDNMKKEPKKGWNWKQWCREKGLEKWFRRDNLIILVLSGVLLLLIALPMEKKGGDTEAGGENGNLTGLELSGMAAGSTMMGRESAQEAFTGMTDEEYAAWLEKRLTDILSQVEGMGKVQVMITLSASQELVVERERSVSRSSTNEADAQGGSRLISQVETGDSVVYQSEGTGSEPYVIKTLPPKVEGVLVVAEGAGSGTVNRTVTVIVRALFGVEAHKVSVVRMESK